MVVGFIHLQTRLRQGKCGSRIKNSRHDGKMENAVLLPKPILVLEQQQQRTSTGPLGSANHTTRTPIALARKRIQRLLDSAITRRRRSQKGPPWNRRMQPRVQRKVTLDQLDTIRTEFASAKQRRKRNSRLTASSSSLHMSSQGIGDSPYKDLDLLQRETEPIRSVEEEEEEEEHQNSSSQSSWSTVHQQPKDMVSSLPLEHIAHQRQGKRIQFTAQHTSKRSLEDLDESLLSLLHEYMTQPVEQYSLLSFHEQQHDLTNNKTNKASTIQSRRWIVRRLTTKEAEFYHNRERGGSAWKQQRYNGTAESFFRLAVPLMPLVGLDLTPVIDLSVDVINNNDKSPEIQRGINDNTNTQHLNNNGRWWSRKEIAALQQHDQVRVRSLRVALLSTDEEVTLAMKGYVRKSDSYTTSSSSNTNHKPDRNMKLRMGYEAIGMAGSLEKIIQPHVSFQSVISWSPSSSAAGTNANNNNLKPFIKVRTEVATSLTLPPLRLPLFPSSVVVANLGSMVTKKALSMVLPHFLRVLCNDFCRWANADAITNSTTAPNSDCDSSPETLEHISQEI